MTEPLKHKDFIKEVYLQLRVNGMVPSGNFLNCYLLCCAKCGESETALAVFKELQDGGLEIELASWEQLISVLAVSNPTKGLDVYEAFQRQTPRKRPSRLIYLKILGIYARIQDAEGLRRTYNEAMEDIVRLHREHQSKKRGQDKNYGLDSKLRLFNAYISGLLECGMTEEALKVYRELEDGKFFAKAAIIKTTMKDTYRLLFRLAAVLKDVKLADHLYSHSRDFAYPKFNDRIDLDHVMYGRMISLSEPDKAVELYDSAMTRLQLVPGTRNYTQLHETMIVTLCRTSPSEAFKCFTKVMPGSGKRLLKTTYFEMLDHMRGEDLSIAYNCFVDEYGDVLNTVPEKYRSKPVRE
jgi:pentatricopeptide repeat protein